MVTTIHDVLAHRAHTDWSSLADFDLGPGRVVAPGVEILRGNWSLYTIERVSNSAIFVDLPIGCDLSESAFAYVDQHGLAQRVMIVPFGELAQLADRIAAPDHVIFLFSIGRCGSTLLSQALNATPGVWSLSEPDAYSRLILQNYNRSDRIDYSRAEVISLIRACTRLLFRPPAGRNARVFAIKFRSQALFQADLYHEALPEASCVFLYRDALGWANSFYRMARKYDFPPLLTGDHRRDIWNTVTAADDLRKLTPFVDWEANELPLEDALAPGWACNMQEYTRHLRDGVPFLALRYNEFNADRLMSLQHLFRHCRLDPALAEKALSAFERDSQAGTLVARDAAADSLRPDQVTRLRKLLARHPDFGDPDGRLADVYGSPGVGRRN